VLEMLPSRVPRTHVRRAQDARRPGGLWIKQQATAERLCVARASIVRSRVVNTKTTRQRVDTRRIEQGMSRVSSAGDRRHPSHTSIRSGGAAVSLPFHAGEISIWDAAGWWGEQDRIFFNASVQQYTPGKPRIARGRSYPPRSIWRRTQGIRIPLSAHSCGQWERSRPLIKVRGSVISIGVSVLGV
jgi:hypothetical protein